MKKNTRSKIAAVAASAIALATVFGLVHRAAPQTADAGPAPLAAAQAVLRQQNPVAAPTATVRSAQALSARAHSSRTVHTTTRVS